MGDRLTRWTPLLTPRRRAEVWYAPVLAAAMGMMMLRMLIMARVLEVAPFARFSAGILVSGTFCMLGCLGLQSMLQREWPVNLIRGQERRAVVRAAQCNLVALGCALVVVVAALFGGAVAGLPPMLLIVGVLHGLSQQVFLIATVESRSRGDALRYAWQNMTRAVLCLSLGVLVAVYSGSAEATLLTEAVLSIVLSMTVFRRALAAASIAVKDVYCLAIRRLHRVSWTSAFALAAVGTVSFALLNIDRWVAAVRLDVGAFAGYSFAWIVLMMAQSVQAVINASMYPVLARRFASEGTRGAFRACKALSLFMLILGGICAIPSWYVLDFGIRRWFPTYSSVIGLLPIFLAVAVLRVSDFWSSYLLIIGREAVLLVFNIAAVAVGLVVWACLTRLWASRVLLPADVAVLALILTL